MPLRQRLLPWSRPLLKRRNAHSVIGVRCGFTHALCEKLLICASMGCAMRLQLHVRRFFCATPQCARQIFTERLPSVVAPYARRTRRLSDVFTLIGFADRAQKQENAWWQGWACLPAPTRSCACCMRPRIPLIQRLACWGWMISRFDDGFPLARS